MWIETLMLRKPYGKRGYIVETGGFNADLTKTYCRNHEESCEYSIMVENILSMFAKKIVSLLKYPYDVVKKDVVVPEWKHYCGAEPRYYTIKMFYTEECYPACWIAIDGGLVWEALTVIKRGGLANIVITYSDGCWKSDDVIAMLKALANKTFVIKESETAQAIAKYLSS